MKLKICGMKYPDNLIQVSALQPDYLGFIFYEPSRRYMGDSLTPEDMMAVPDRIQKIGVFVDSSVEYMVDRAKHFGLNGFQLHGNETPGQCQTLKEAGYVVIKVFGLGSESFDYLQLDPYQPYVDYFLFDTLTPEHGGSGQTFDWEQLRDYTLPVPFFLSGGIGIDNLKQALQVDHPQLYGLDVNSRFELEPGRKDVPLLQKLANQLRKQGG